MHKGCGKHFLFFGQVEGTISAEETVGSSAVWCLISLSLLCSKLSVPLAVSACAAVLCSHFYLVNWACKDVLGVMQLPVCWGIVQCLLTRR